jgi:AraC-like DNA-binding protein
VHLYRKIKALTNLSAIEFIRSIRLKTAEKILRENKLNINEISLMVGFNDTDYFRECFKEQYGMSPKEYARKNSQM